MDNEAQLSRCETDREYHAANDIAVDLHEQAGLLDAGVGEWGDTEWLGDIKAWNKYEELTKNL